MLKDDDLSTVWEQVQGLRSFLKKHRRTRIWHRPNGTTVREVYRWSPQLFYRDLTVHVLEYAETIQDQPPSRWAWITNIDIDWETCVDLAHAGRLSWKIENEGFNCQKNGGYGLEHVWSYNLQAQKNFWLM